MGKIIRIVISVALLAVLGWKTDWVLVGRTFAHLRLDLWLGAVGLYVASQVVSGLRWQLLARPLGFRRPLRQYVGFYFIGMFFSLVLPTSVGGDVVRAWYLENRSGKRVPAFVSVFVDRLSGFLVLLSLACAAVAVCPIPVPRWVVASVWGSAACAVVGMASIPVLLRFSNFDFRLPMLRRNETERAAGILHRGEPPTPSENRNTRVKTTFRLYLSRPRLLLATAGLSAVVQAANVALVWLVGRAIGAPVPGAYYWILVPMVSLLTLLPVSLNGMGVREGATVLFLAPLGIQAGTAFSLAFLWFAVTTAAALFGGFVYLFGSFPRPEVQPDHEPVCDRADQGRAGQSQAAA